MAWIQVDIGIKEHDKIFNLADVLKITDAHAVGLMVCLWTWAVTAAPDGDITNFPPRAIARAAGWDKKPTVFYDAICAPASLFVETVDGRRKFRNWDERFALLINAVERNKEQTRKRVQRYRERNSTICDVTDNDDVTLGNADVTVNSNDVMRYSNAECSVTERYAVTGVTEEKSNVTHLPVPIPIQVQKPITTPPLSPPPTGEGGKHDNVEIWEKYPLSPELETAVRDWCRYKREKRQGYKPEGLNSLLSTIRNRAAEYGDTAVIELIRESMAANYTGITWDKLRQTGGERFGRTDVCGGNTPQHGFRPEGMAGFHNALDGYDDDGNRIDSGREQA